MAISDKIEAFITALFADGEENEWIELGRNELASVFNCVPSQINYVISTRFNKEHGYIVESKRGGGGYLRIKKIISDEDNLIFRIIKEVGERLSASDAYAYTSYLKKDGFINATEELLIKSAVSDNSLIIAEPEKDILRAVIFKNMLAALI